MASEAEILSSQTGFDCGHCGQDIFCTLEQGSIVATEVEILSSKQVSTVATVVKIRHWQLGNSCLSCFKWASRFLFGLFHNNETRIANFSNVENGKICQFSGFLTILSHLTEIFCLS